MFIKISSININNNKENNLVRVKSLFKEARGDANFGKIVILGESYKNNKDSEDLIELISNTIEKEYYLNDKMTLNEDISTIKIEAYFESALVKTEKLIHKELELRQLNLKSLELSISVLLFYKGEIFLSNTGTNKAILVRSLKRDFDISDIDPEEEKADEESQDKLFSSIINGEVPMNSYIIICTNSMLDYISNEESIQTLDTFNFNSALERIKNNISEINPYINLGAIIIKSSQKQEREEKRAIETQNNFIQREKEVHEAEKETAKILNNQSNSTEKIANLFKKIFSFTKIFKKIKFKSKVNKNNDSHKIIQSVKSEKTSRKKFKKIMIITAIILLAILAFNIYNSSNKETEKISEEDLSTLIESIESKQNSIDNFLLYNNNDPALELINELKQELDNLSESEKKGIENIEDIQSKLNEQYNQLIKMYPLNTAQEVANIKIINDSANTQSIAKLNDSIYIADASNSTIYVVDLATGISSTLSTDNRIKASRIISSLSYNNSVYFLSENHIIEINNNKEIDFKNIEIENINNIESFRFYMRWPYLLTKEGEVLRYELSGNNYQSPSNRINEDAYQDKKDMQISTDGSIYVLRLESEIIQYYNAAEIDKIEIKNIDPQIQNPDQFYLSDQYIYLIDKTNKRLVIITREGQSLVKQYSLDFANTINDVIIDNANQSAYILNDNILNKVELEL